MDRKIIITDIDGVDHVLPSKAGQPIYEAILTMRRVNEDGMASTTLPGPEIRIGYVTLDQATRDLGLTPNVLGTLIRNTPWSVRFTWARIREIVRLTGAQVTVPKWPATVHPWRVLLHLAGAGCMFKAVADTSRQNAWEPSLWLLGGIALWILADNIRADAGE